MSLLSGLLDHMPPTIAGTDSPKAASHPRLRLVAVKRIERPAQLLTSPHVSAATATPAWRHARDQYLNHIMACRDCYAPTARYCLPGADLHASYENTPMELPR
jgi:hypothetical protein